MTAEIYNMREGVISWVSASGNSPSFATAASSPSGIAVGFVRSFNYASGATFNTVMNRGVPNHHKTVTNDPITLDMSYGYSGGNGIPSYPVHVQFFVNNAPNGSAFWVFNSCVRPTHNFAENEQENTMSDSFIALGMIEATASGYLSTS